MQSEVSAWRIREENWSAPSSSTQPQCKTDCKASEKGLKRVQISLIRDSKMYKQYLHLCNVELHCTIRESVFPSFSDCEQHELCMVTNTIRLILETEMINWREADSKSFSHDCLEVFAKESQKEHYSFLLLLSSLSHPSRFSITLFITALSRQLLESAGKTTLYFSCCFSFLS